MQFSIIAASLFAGAAMAWESTAYTTVVHTTTSCGPEVTNCPARSHTTSYPIPTSSVFANSSVPAVPAVPVASGTPSSVVEVPTTSAEGSVVPATSPASSPATSPASGPSGVVSTITISTCVPTVITSIVTVTPTPTAPATPETPVSSPEGSVETPATSPAGAASPSGTGVYYPPSTPSSFVPANSAGSIQSSFFVVAAAGLAAFAFA